MGRRASRPRERGIPLDRLLPFFVVALAFGPGPAPAAPYTAGQAVEVLRFSEWVPGRFSKQTETQVCVMLPLADGRYDPAVSVVYCTGPEHVRPAGGPAKPAAGPAPGPAAPRPQGPAPGAPPAGPGGFFPGQDVELSRFREWVPSRVSKVTETQVCVMLPLPDGSYDPAVCVVYCAAPGDVRPVGKPAVAAPAPGERVPGTGPVTPARPLQPGRMVWHHTGAFEPFALVGTWLTQGHVVKVVHREKQLDADTLEQTYSMGGGHVGGHVHIRPDGTFVRVAPSGKKFSGKYSVESSTHFKGLVLWGGDEPTGWGKDLVVTPVPGGEINVQAYPSGGAGYRGWRAGNTTGLDLSDGPAR